MNFLTYRHNAKISLSVLTVLCKVVFRPDIAKKVRNGIKSEKTIEGFLMLRLFSIINVHNFKLMDF